MILFLHDMIGEYHDLAGPTINSGNNNRPPGPSKVFEVGVYSLENRRLPKVVVAFAAMKERSG